MDVEYQPGKTNEDLVLMQNGNTQRLVLTQADRNTDRRTESQFNKILANPNSLPAMNAQRMSANSTRDLNDTLDAWTDTDAVGDDNLYQMPHAIQLGNAAAPDSYLVSDKQFVDAAQITDLTRQSATAASLLTELYFNLPLAERTHLCKTLLFQHMQDLFGPIEYQLYSLDKPVGSDLQRALVAQGRQTPDQTPVLLIDLVCDIERAAHCVLSCVRSIVVGSGEYGAVAEFDWADHTRYRACVLLRIHVAASDMASFAKSQSFDRDAIVHPHMADSQGLLLAESPAQYIIYGYMPHPLNWV